MDPALIGLAGSVCGAVALVLTVWRQRSGHVATSEAKDLWAESTNIRVELRAELADLREAHIQCEADLRVQRLAAAELEHRVKVLEGTL